MSKGKHSFSILKTGTGKHEKKYMCKFFSNTQSNLIYEIVKIAIHKRKLKLMRETLKYMKELKNELATSGKQH